MRSFNYQKLKYETWDSQILSYIAMIYRANGRQEIFLNKDPATLNRLVEIAKVQSTESSNAIEGIRTTNTRIRQLVAQKTAPRNRDEEEIAGYRDVLSLIHDSYDAIPVTPNYILQLHKMLYSYNTHYQIGGKFKDVQNYISSFDEKGEETILFVPPDPVVTPDAIENICEEYKRARATDGIEPLLLIGVFIHDFLCIHPFNDGNGRMSRILTTLLLYQSGFTIVRYISLEKIIADNKDLYYDALSLSQKNWYEGKEDPRPFIKYLLSVICRAYADFENRVDMLGEKADAASLVSRAIDKKIGRFTKADILELCPTISLNSVEKQLTILSRSGIIVKSGSGKNTYYLKKEEK